MRTVFKTKKHADCDSKYLGLLYPEIVNFFLADEEQTVGVFC